MELPAARTIETNMEKTCTKCSKTKPLAEYYKRKGGKWGVDSHCKTCDKIKSSSWESKNRARRAERSKKRRADNLEVARREVEKVRAYQKRYPEKQKARRALDHAIEMGRVLRGECEECGVFPAHAHHEDYSKPYEVRWFCPLHHAQHHALQAAH